MRNLVVLTLFSLQILLPIKTLASEVSSKTVNEEAVVFATDPWPPFFVRKNVADPCVCDGTAVDLLNTIFNQIDGYFATFPYTPWKRGLLDLQQGRKDAMALVLKKPGREEFMLFSKPVFEINTVLFSRYSKFKSGFEWTDMDDLHGLRIGVVEGYTYGKEFDELIESKKVTVASLAVSEQGFKMLALDRIDLLAENRAVGEEIIKTVYPNQTFHISQKPVNQDVLYIVVSKNSPRAHVIREINSVLERMEETGEVKRILSGADANGE